MQSNETTTNTRKNVLESFNKTENSEAVLLDVDKFLIGYSITTRLVLRKT